jgi:C4-dicarboxylate transporter DctM subunit
VIASITLTLLLAFLLLSIPVAVTLAVLGLSIAQIFSPFPIHRAIGEIAWSASTDFILLAIPLFVMLGEILLQAGIAARTYNALDKWLSWLPGGLLHSNIGTSALFRGHLGFQRSHRGYNHHRGPTPGAPVWLRGEFFCGLDCLGWHLGHPDPAVD